MLLACGHRPPDSDTGARDTAEFGVADPKWANQWWPAEPAGEGLLGSDCGQTWLEPRNAGCTVSIVGQNGDRTELKTFDADGHRVSDEVYDDGFEGTTTDAWDEHGCLTEEVSSSYFDDWQSNDGITETCDRAAHTVTLHDDTQDGSLDSVTLNTYSAVAGWTELQTEGSAGNYSILFAFDGDHMLSETSEPASQYDSSFVWDGDHLLSGCGETWTWEGERVVSRTDAFATVTFEYGDGDPVHPARAHWGAATPTGSVPPDTTQWDTTPFNFTWACP